jgi:hypothetical protein
MAAIASRAEVAQIEPQVRLLGNRYHVVSVQVALATVVSLAKLSENEVGGRITQIEAPTLSDDDWLPSAIYAAPAVSLEAENS